MVQCRDFCGLEDSRPMTLDVDNPSDLTAFLP